MAADNGAPRISTPILDVTLDDGRTLRVQALNPDLLRYDRTAAKHSWPTYSMTGELKAPFLWLTFLAWSALRRTGQIDDGISWDAFSSAHCLQVLAVTGGNGQEEADVVNPTLSEVEPG